jgi:hypothetical protein
VSYIFKTLAGIAAWQNLLPNYLFITGNSMKRIIGHTMCGICQSSLPDATHVEIINFKNTLLKVN